VYKFTAVFISDMYMIHVRGNQCSYCHALFIRGTIDISVAHRIAENVLFVYSTIDT